MKSTKLPNTAYSSEESKSTEKIDQNKVDYSKVKNMDSGCKVDNSPTDITEKSFQSLTENRQEVSSLIPKTSENDDLTLDSIVLIEEELCSSGFEETNKNEDLPKAIEEIVEIETELIENLFPTEVFPSLFQDLIFELKKTLNFPEDYTGTALLAAVSTMVGTTAKIKVKEGWYEYSPIYCCLIGKPGANKTYPINKIFSVIKNIDKINNDLFTTDYGKYQEYQNLSKLDKSKVAKIIEPHLKKSVLTNFTPEVLNKRLSQNLRGCIIVSDEIISFFDGMNNYSKGDQLGIYLSFWSNQPTTIDRIGTPIPSSIETPFLSIIGSLQPGALSIAFPPKKLQSGFLQRFLFAFPSETLKIPINDNELNQLHLDNYETYVKEYYLKHIPKEISGQLNSNILNWTEEAKDFFYKWQSENCALVNENSNSIKGEIISKFDNHFIRLSLLLQLMEDPESKEIGITAVQGAKKLCKYFMNCSFKVLEAIQSPKEYFNNLPENKKQFYFTLKEDFTTAEAVLAGANFDLSERRVKEFLKNKTLFTSIKHGFYKKALKV